MVSQGSSLTQSLTLQQPVRIQSMTAITAVRVVLIKEVAYEISMRTTIILTMISFFLSALVFMTESFFS